MSTGPFYFDFVYPEKRKIFKLGEKHLNDGSHVFAIKRAVTKAIKVVINSRDSLTDFIER